MKLHLQFATEASVPTETQFEAWLQPLHDFCEEDQEILVRVVDEPEMMDLNERYRSKSGPTNVLSFPFESPPGVELPILGDVVICAPVVYQQADDQKKQADDHWAHLLIHGGLHLLGYDHISAEEAEEMESIEIRLLQQLGIENPYQ